MDDAVFFLLLVLFSIVPSLAFTAWMRNREGLAREPWSTVLRAFLFGAVVGSTLALILNQVFDTAAYYYGLGAGVGGGFITAVVVAPLVEEAVKGGGLSLQKRRILELEDGLVYGAAIGFGFAATENIVYGLSAWFEDGQTVATQVVFLRALSSTVLHGGLTALIGFGYSRAVLTHGFGAARMLPYYLIAVAVHALYNLLLRLETFVGVAIAVVMAWGVVTWANDVIGKLDAMPHQR